MYRVIRYFTDMQDNGRPYSAGETFPREGLLVSADRIKELSSGANLQGVPLIEEVRGAVETGEPDKAVPVEDEPKKRGRKRK